VIEEEVGHDGVAISLNHFMSRGMCRAAARNGIKQCELVGFAIISLGPRRVGLFRLSDDWRALDADQARLPMPPRESGVPPKPPKPVEPLDAARGAVAAALGMSGGRAIACASLPSLVRCGGVPHRVRHVACNDERR